MFTRTWTIFVLFESVMVPSQCLAHIGLFLLAVSTDDLCWHMVAPMTTVMVIVFSPCCPCDTFWFCLCELGSHGLLSCSSSSELPHFGVKVSLHVFASNQTNQKTNTASNTQHTTHHTPTTLLLFSQTTFFFSRTSALSVVRLHATAPRGGDAGDASAHA